MKAKHPTHFKNEKLGLFFNLSFYVLPECYVGVITRTQYSLRPEEGNRSPRTEVIIEGQFPQAAFLYP